MFPIIMSLFNNIGNVENKDAEIENFGELCTKAFYTVLTSILVGSVKIFHQYWFYMIKSFYHSRMADPAVRLFDCNVTENSEKTDHLYQSCGTPMLLETERSI